MAMIVPANQVDLWCAFLDDDGALDLESVYRGLLSSDEAQRYARFHFERDRRQFLLTRALVRDVLSRYVAVKPYGLVFTRNEYGKPALAEPAPCPVVFSLSHTKGLSVCAVASAQMIGVDVESLDRRNCHPDVAKRFFAPSEAAYLEGLGGDERRLQFLRLWTLKEAYVKARGRGLSIPLNSFAIAFAPKEAARLSCSDRNHDDAADWQFLQVRLRGSFHIAIALPMAERRGIGIRFAKLLPLTEESRPTSLEANPLNAWALDA